MGGGEEISHPSPTSPAFIQLYSVLFVCPTYPRYPQARDTYMYKTLIDMCGHKQLPSDVQWSPLQISVLSVTQLFLKRCPETLKFLNYTMHDSMYMYSHSGGVHHVTLTSEVACCILAMFILISAISFSLLSSSAWALLRALSILSAPASLSLALILNSLMAWLFSLSRFNACSNCPATGSCIS